MGSGMPGRPYSSNGRNAIWKKIVSEAGGFDVHVIAEFHSLDEALAKEKHEIWERKPEANLVLKSQRKPRTKTESLFDWGGKRPGSGRPRKPYAKRCPCGANTLRRAQRRGFECCKRFGVGFKSHE